MKLFVVAIVLTAGHLAAARDPKELAYNDHIQKSGKPLPGEPTNQETKIQIFIFFSYFGKLKFSLI